MEETELASLAAPLRDFAKRRDWDQFHTPKNLAAALIVEAGAGRSERYTRFET